MIIAFIIAMALLLMALLLMAIAIYSVIKQRIMWESFAQDFTDKIEEAHQLKADFNNMMENAVNLSRSLVDELDAQVLSSESESTKGNDPTMKPIITPDKDITKVKELAEELGINSEDLLVYLAELGYDYNSPLNKSEIDLGNIAEKPFNSPSSLVDLGVEKDTAIIKEELSQVITDSTLDLEQVKTAHPYIAVRILEERGHSIKEIAKLLGRGQGEISLLLNLSKKAKVI